MNLINKAVNKKSIVEDCISLEEILTMFLDYGSPRLSYVSYGWHCNIEMNVNSTGVNFKVASEFDHKTAREAALVCHARLTNALATLRN